MTQLRLTAFALRRLYLTCLPVAALPLAACNSDALSVGSNDDALQQAACNGGVYSGSLYADRQEQIDELSGCQVIDGDLRISGSDEEPAELSLAALRSLRLVRGSLTIEGVSSLDGLETLEQAGTLNLARLGVSDLGALRNLQRVIWDPPGGGDGGIINISECPALEDLGGLEHLTSWQSLKIGNCPALESLDGVVGPPRFAELRLYRLPALREVSALNFARIVDTVNIERTGIESLDGFGLAQAESLGISENPALTSLDGLSQLLRVTSLGITDNDALQRVNLPALERAQIISITGNDSLTSVPRYSSTQYLAIEFGPKLDFVNLNQRLFEVGNNARLTSVASPEGFSNVQQVAIWSNPALEDLDLYPLERADGLMIRKNPALSRLLAVSLERVAELEVVDNPALSTAALSDVQTFHSTISGNRDAPTP